MVIRHLNSRRCDAELGRIGFAIRWVLIFVASWACFHLPRFEVRGASNSDQRCPGASEIFHCQFDDAADPNQAGWPDGWSRERGAGYPRYLEARIDLAAPNSSCGRSLRMDLDGGAAAAYSPTISVRPKFSYVFQCQVRTEGLTHDRAFMSVTFYDTQNKVLERQISTSVGSTTAWTKLQIGPVAPASDAIDHAVIGLHLEPTDQADLHGSAWFADVWAGRLPRMNLEADRANRLYIDPQRPTISFTSTGLENRDASVDFTLIDVDGRELAKEQMRLEISESTSTNTWDGRATWMPPLPDVGLYRVRARLNGRTDMQHERELALVLIREEKPASHGEFGWSLQSADKRRNLNELPDFVRQAGINWLKYPIWDEPPDAEHVEQLYAFAQRLRSENIELVGVLANPPADVRKHFGDKTSLAAAQIFSAEPDVWYPSMEPICTRLSQIVRSWQLGADDDLSFVNDPALPATIGRVQQQMERFGQRAKIGIAWSWTQPLPAQSPLKFVSLAAEPSCSSQAQADFLDATNKSNIGRWVPLAPLPADQYSLLDRAADLSQQMMQAKIAHADRIFIPHIYNSRVGLCDETGAVGDLFLPWRTTARQLAGADDEGSLRLPGGTRNRVFSRDREMLMVAWNEKPCAEQVNLGAEAEQIDLWGRTKKLVGDSQGQQQIKADRLPIFLTRLNEPLVRWQMAASLVETRWPSVFGVPYNNAVVVTNPFSQTVAGTVRLIAPDRWRVVPREISFKLAAGETQQLPLEITMPFDTVNGPQDVRLEFDISADRRYRFSVYRTITIGLDDVTLDVATRLNEQGELVVEQKVVNKTDDPVSFRCSLFVPDRQRMITQVVDQGRGADVQTYRLPRGNELIGKTIWLRADELTGRRTLNNRFQVKP